MKSVIIWVQNTMKMRAVPLVISCPNQAVPKYHIEIKNLVLVALKLFIKLWMMFEESMEECEANVFNIDSKL